MTERGWLIERESIPLFIGLCGSRLAWAGADRSIRFARREDGEAMLQSLRHETRDPFVDSARVTVHAWDLAPSLAA